MTVSRLYFVIRINVFYWLFKCGVMHIVCVCVCVCVCMHTYGTCTRTVRVRVCERERERERGSHQNVVSYLNLDLCANTYKLHHCVCHVTLFPTRAWTDGKTKDIINCLYFYFESWSSQLWKGALHFWHALEGFGQSQCIVLVGQSEQTVLFEGGTL